jgi:RNA polymerase sigma-70 factor (ECF subfamily)
MPGASMNRVVQFLRRAVTPTGSEEDGELLRRFITAGEEAAFAGLVRRHGAMVFGVCRRLLNDIHDAEDAFQATFLVLARRAASIRKPDAVASWLYGVAYRVARRARMARRTCPLTDAVEPISSADPVAEASWRELRPVIDEELNRLPEKYRAPLVLCYLEGRTNEEAARLLGWTKGTVSGRLARARDLLRPRLARRGLALPVGGVAAVLAHAEGAPAALLETTVKTALAGSASVPATVLAEGVMRAMFVKKMTTLAAVVLTLGLAGAGIGLLRQPGPVAAGDGEEKEAPKSKAGVIFNLPEVPKKEPDDLEKMQGTWQAVAIEHNGENLPAEAVKVFKVVIDKDYINFRSTNSATGTTFKLEPASKPKVISVSLGIRLDKSDKREAVRGIYALEDGRLKICIDNDEGKTTPTEFATKAGSGLTLLVLERAGEAKAHTEKPKAAEKRYTFSMQNKPWKDVLEWFSDQTDLVFVGTRKPSGTFTFVSPKGKEYTISEIVDILNEALMAEKDKYILIVREKTFTLHPADEPLPRNLPASSLEDLPKKGKTEIVRLIVTLKEGRATDVAPTVKKLMSPFGDVIPIWESNALILIDTAGSLREVVKTLSLVDQASEKPAPGLGSDGKSLPGPASGLKPVQAVAFLRNSNTVLACPEDGRVASWDAATHKLLSISKGDGNKCLSMAASPDGKLILLGGAVTGAVKKKDGDETVELDGWLAVYTPGQDKPLWHNDEFSAAVRAVAFSSDGKRVAAVGGSRLIVIHDAETGQAIKSLGPRQKGRQTAVAFSPDGKLLAVGGDDKRVRLWDVTTGKEVRTLAEHLGEITAVAFSPDGRLLLTACGDCDVQLWDVASGREALHWVAATKGVRSAVFSPDGKLIATGANAGTVELWSFAVTKRGPSFSGQAKSVASYKGHTRAVNGLAFSPDGKSLVSGSADGTVKLWDVGK